MIPSLKLARAERGLTRHDLVWLDRTHWRGALASPGGATPVRPWHRETAERELERWFGRGLPAVVCRQEDVRAGHVALGVALSLSHGKLKVPLTVRQDAIVRSASPLPLRVAAESLSNAWRDALQELLVASSALGITFRVYGSVAWQHLSGEAYLTESSDVDLLWRADDGAMLDAGLAVLSRWQRQSGIRADGEVRFPNGAAVAWPELLSAPRKVLVKHERCVALCETKALFDPLLDPLALALQ